MATPYDPYDLEQDAFMRNMGGNNTTMPVAGKPVKDTADYGAVNTAQGGAATPETGAASGAASGNSRATRDALGGYAGVGQMGGFRQDDYGGDVKARNSMKNTFGRIASRYGANRQGLESLMADPDFQRYFPNARLGAENGRGGIIDFGGLLSDFESGTPVGAVDVLKAYDGENADEWQWGDQNYVNDAGGGGGAMQGGGGGQSDLMSAILGNGGLSGNDTLEKIQKELQALIQGQPSDVAQNAFLGAMR